jgi:hypothetical protein
MSAMPGAAQRQRRKEEDKEAELNIVESLAYCEDRVEQA